MALEKVGVQFVTDGLNKFMGEIADAQKAIVEMGKSITQNKIDALAVLGNTAKEVSGNYVDALKSANAVNTQATSSSDNMASQLSKTTNEVLKLGDAFKQVAVQENKVSLKQSFAGLWEGVSRSAGIGATIGGLIGTVVPGIGNVMGAAGGAVIGALMKLQSNVRKAIGDFFRDLGKAILAFLPELVRDIVKAGMQIVATIANIVKSILTFAGQIGKAILSVFGVRGDIGDSLLASMIKFEILKQSIRKVLEVIKTLARDALNAAISLQTLNVRLDNLIASQVRAAGVTDNYSRSISVASDYSQELLGWMQRLALETPIGIDAISDTVSLSVAMGWGVDASKELTEAIVNYTAGAGLSNDIMERIIYNFAQMRNAGKVTGTELRDLARGAFLPVNKILDVAAQRLGIAADSMAEFREAAASGAIDVQTFFDAFIEVINTDFPDAARKMNYTFAAVKDNLEDVFETVIGWNILNPVIENLAETAQKFLAIFQRPDVIMFTKVLGRSLVEVVEGMKSALSAIFNSLKSVFRAIFPEVEQPINRLRGELGRMYEELEFGKFEKIIIFFVKLSGAIEHVGKIIAQAITDKIVPKAEEMGDKLDDTFTDISEDAFSWGAKMVVNFAAGIARGIATALTWAINSISSFLSFWLQPQSPPNIAPDIDLWGMQTIAEWLHGFTMADFDVIKSLGDNLRGSLESLFYLGAMSEDAVLPTFRDIYVELIAAMDDFNETGVMAESIFERLSNIGGVYGDELATLLDLQLELAFGVERVAAAQEAYNAAVAATKISTATTNKMIREYNALLRGGASEQSLRDKLLAVQASQIQLALDHEQEQAAQEELDAAEEALKPLEEAVKLQEELIGQLIELAKLEKEIADARADTGGGGGAGEGEENPFDPTAMLPTGGAATIEWEALFNHFKDIALNELSTLWGELAVIWGDPFAPVITAWDNMMYHLEQTWDTFSKVFDFSTFEETFGTTFDPTPELPQSMLDLVGGNIYGPTDEENTRLARILSTISTIIETAGNALKNVDWEAVVTKVVKIVTDIWNAVKDVDWKSFIDGIVKAAKKVSTWISEHWDEFASAVSKFVDVVTWLWGALSTVVDWLGPSGPSLGGETGGAEENAEGGTGDTSGTSIENFVVLIWTKILEGFSPESLQWVKVGGMIIEGFLEGVADAALEKWDALGQWVYDYIIQPVLDALRIDSPSGVFKDIGIDTVQGFIDGAVSLLETIWTDWFVEPFNNFLNSVLEFFGMGKEGKTADSNSVFGGIGTGIIQGFIDGATTLLTNIWDNVFRDPFQTLISGVRGFFGLESTGDDNEFFSIGTDIIQGLIDGITSMVANVRAEIEEIASNLPAWVQDILGITSPSTVMFGIGEDTMEGLENGLESKAKSVRATISNIASDLVSIIEDMYVMNSPSEVFGEMGENMMLGMANGVTRASSSVNKAINNALGSNMRPGRLTMPITMSAMPVNAGNSVTFGDVYVNDRIDLATLKSYVQQMVLER